MGVQKFDCPNVETVSETVPDSVHALRPGDVKVVGTIGDSLSVSNFCVKNILQIIHFVKIAKNSSLARFLISLSQLSSTLQAGNGAKARNFFELILEYRGQAFTGGGDDDITKHVTMPS